MHYHLEIVMPPTDDVAAAVTQILAPFDESPTPPPEYGPSGNEFFDYWVLGGRWSGSKIKAAFSQERLDAFFAALTEAKVTVSGFVAGKEEISPASQIPAVDALWCEHFPESPIKVCPMFKHYKGNIGDVMRLDQLPAELTASRVIIAGVNYDGNGLEAKHMLADEIWNGCNHEKTAWSGKVLDALTSYTEHIEHYNEEYRAKYTPQPDWLVVTIDYHS